MKKNQPSNFYDLLFKWQKNRNVKQIQCFVLFFSFLCIIPQTTHAQQEETAVLLKEKKAPAIVESSEEEEGTPEAEKEHQRSVWYKGIQKKNPNYYRVKRLFESYFRKNKDEDSKPKQICTDWLKTQIFYLDKKNRVVAPPRVDYNNIQKLAGVSWATVTDTMAGDWRMVGPRNTYQTGYSSTRNRGGYVSCARIDPNNINKLFIGFTTGGLWVSADGGAVWQLTDKNLPNKEYIDIDVCKANSNIVYAISGDAVIKSTDGGLTWTSTFLNSTNYSGKAYDIAVSPTNSNIVLARWGTTLYRTTDGGASWSSVLTGLKNYSVWGGTNISAEVLDFHAADSNVVYHLDRNDSQNYVTLYRSADAGVTFASLGNINIPVGAVGNIIGWSKLLTASNNPAALYVTMGTGTSAYGHRSAHMLKLNPTTGAILQTRVEMVPEAQGVHHADIAMDVNNDNNIVYGTYGANKTYYSSDNGATFTQSVTAVHSDLRALSVVNGNVLLGTDGEACFSTNNGADYTSLTAAVSNHELWGFGAAHKTDVLGAGTNHGPLMIREHEGSQGWYNAMGADQQNTDVNPLDDKFIYSAGYSSYHVERTGVHTMNSGANMQQINPGSNGYNTMHFHPNLYYTLITHHGGNSPSRPELKNSLIRSDDNGITANIIKTFNAEIRREDICMSDPNRVYVVEGASNQKLWKTTDLGVTWTEITPSTADTGTSVRNISDVAVSDVNPNEIWVTYSGVQDACKVLHSTDGGVTYNNLTTATLTTWPITKMLFQRGTNGGIYVGNRMGVFYRNNNMSDWQLIGNGLPMTDVRFMFINYFKGKLMIGTSRGAWDHDLYELTAPKAQISASTNKITTCGSSVNFADYSVLHNDAQTSYSWSFPGGNPSTSTLEKPVVNYSVPGNYDVSLTVTDQYGSSTQTLPNFISVECTTSVVTGSVTSTADAYVYDGAVNNNYGTASGLIVKKDGPGYAREAYLKFDLNTLPSTADKVTLRLNVASASNPFAGTNWQVYYVPTDSWTETGITWSNKPAPSTLVATVTGKSSGIVEWDITSQALSELASDKILSLKIVSTVTGGNTVGTFSSREEANAGLRPQIITSIINKVPTVSITSPANNAVIAAGSDLTINTNATDVDGTVSKVEFYQGSTLLGESTTAPYSFTWNNPAVGSYVLTAKVTDNYGVTTPSLDVNVLVNALPTVSITSPVNSSVFAPGFNVTINANAVDADGTITKVEFYQGSTLLGESTTAPYSFTWNNPAVGTYALTAKATDNNNEVTTSSVVNITVNAAPTVSITSPADNATFAAGSNVTINANAADTDGTITKVEFYQGSTYLGQSTSAPYSFTWNNPAGGTYTLTAKATDNLGGVATSTPVGVSITVTQPPLTTTPVADAYVRDGSYVRTNYGTQTTLDVKNDVSSYFRQSYLRFNYSTFTGSVAGNVKLRVYVSFVNTDPSRVVSVYAISNTTWVENKINWNNQPSETGTLLGSYTITDVIGVWYELDVTSYINNQLALGNKIVSFRLVNQGVLSTTNNVSFNSREASANKPQLVLTYGSSSGRMKTDIGTKTDVDDPISFNVIASPNPSTSEFKVQVESSNNEPLQVRIFNANQQLIKQLKASVGETITFGSNLPSGMYVIEVKQGLERKVVKVIKL